VNTLQEWCLINTSPDLAHPLHIHVNHFQVCKQSVVWRRTVIHHKVCKTESWKVVSILKLLFVNLDWNKIFKLIIKLEICHKSYIWFEYFWLLSVSSFLFELRIWARLKHGSKIFDEMPWKPNLKTSCCFTAQIKAS